MLGETPGSKLPEIDNRGFQSLRLPLSEWSEMGNACSYPVNHVTPNHSTVLITSVLATHTQSLIFKWLVPFHLVIPMLSQSLCQFRIS